MVGYHRAVIHFFVHKEERHACLTVTIKYCSLNGGGAAVAWEERGVDSNSAEAWEHEKFFREDEAV